MLALPDGHGRLPRAPSRCSSPWRYLSWPRPAATSNAVTPEPIAPPSNVLLGTPQKVGYDQYSMTIGGQRVYITADRCPGLGRCRLPVPVPWPAGAGHVT
jgi:hypothetical protein